MTTPFLTTKLSPVPPDLAPRPRLIKRLREIPYSNRKPTLIFALAGLGKTLLSSEWPTSKDSIVSEEM